MKTAIVIGATGLVGAALTRQLLDHPDYSAVVVFTRRTTGITHEKLTENLVDFNHISDWSPRIKGDVLFSAMGTTLNKAGNKAAQWTVDYTYQLGVASAAASNGIPCFVLISSAGASENSMIFYSRMKGEIDREARKLPFERIRIIKPGILSGQRNETRPMEALSIRMMEVFGKIPFIRRYRPYPATTVAKAMINAAALEEKEFREFELEAVFDLAGQS